jgi:hypothetical protein
MGYLKRNVLIDYKKSFVTQNGQYDKQDNLVLMIRPGPTDIPGDSAVDISKNSHTVTYGRHNAAQDPVQNDIDTPFSLSPVSFNPDSFNCRSRSDITYINVADANDLSFDDNPGASPFSISLWFKGNPQKDGYWSYLMGKDGEYRIKESTLGGVLQVHLLTTTANYVYLNSTTSGLVSDGKWHHMVVTYNGTSASREIAVYIDGALESSGVGSLVGSGYSGMTAGSGDLRWGSYSTSGNTHCGKVSEMGIWNVVLSAPDVKAIYEATQGVYRSGIISNPTRIMLQDRDNRTGSYPTISRTGDPDFTGRFASTFDDTNTIIFDVGQKLYPANLPAGSKFVSGGVATPNVLQGLTAIGTSSVGVADSHVSFTPGENISPFTDSRLYIDNNSSFFATGTASGTLPGFSQRLGSKTSFSFSYSTPDPTVIFFATNSAGSLNPKTLGPGSGVGYFNFSKNNWEMLEPEDVDCYSDDPEVRQKSVFCFQPDDGYSDSSNIRVLENVGLPVSDFGFPSAFQYNATGSQCLFMSGVLTAPFLLEKIRIYASGIFGLAPANTSQTPYTKQFFLLNQLTAPISNVSSSFDHNLFVTGVGQKQTYQKRGARDLVGWGNVAFVRSDSEFQDAEYQDIWDASVSVTSTETNIRRAHTGSFVLELVPRIATFSEGVGSFKVRRTGFEINAASTKFAQLRNNLGARDLRGSSSGRSFIKGVVGSDIASTASLSGGTSFGDLGKAFIPTSRYETSPYILLPSDRLIFGWNAHPRRVGSVSTTTSMTNQAEEVFTWLSDEISHFKVDLFGSLLRNNLPVESETNQPLTSDAVHEDLHYDNPVYDQWDVEPRAALTGSYVDLVITGSMLVTNAAGEFGDPWGAPGTRRVVYSVAAGQAGPSGSLQRFVRLDDSTDKFYDANVPEIRSFLNLLGATAEDQSPAGPPYGTHTLFLDARGGVASSQSALDFVRSYPFAGVLSSVRRTQSPEKFLEVDIVNGRGNVGKLSAVGYLYKTNDTVSSDTEFVPGAAAPGPRQTHQNAIKTLFGFVSTTPTVSGSKVPDIGNANGATYAVGEVKIRGYKYGLGGLFGSSLDARFRRDKYGQFRDMLEPRRYPATLRGSSVDYPVRINFVSQDSQKGGSTTPLRTHSQNLSPFSTSSLPYFDGLTVDRGDNPDETLRPVEIELTVS